MIPLVLGCLIGGCLDVPIDNRPLHRQIWEDQLNRNEHVYSCYSEGKFYENCNERNPWGFEEDDTERDRNWRND